MSKPVVYLFIIALISGISSGCNKRKGCTDPMSINYDRQAQEDDGSCKLAGDGGNTTIVAYPKHHGKSIVSHDPDLDSAFVKFNAIEFPGSDPGNYDRIFVGEDGENHVHLEGLKPGRYYIYMTGFDNSIQKRVAGGIPYILYASSGEVDLNVPVTE